ncbi:MAG: nicotinate-nucleotide--dimethylbenzimidazole phosphoribosyltransferase [Pseudomonadota bacterium]
MSVTPSVSGLPFDDLKALFQQMPDADQTAVAEVKARDKVLTKPPGALGRLEDIVEWLAAWQGKAPPTVLRPLVAIFAGNHGVTEQGVSAFPASVTQQMVENFAAGGAAVNQICVTHGLGLKVFDLALDLPTPDVSREDAFDEPSCAATFAFGMEAVAGEVDLLCVGEMGIGNTTVAAAILYALYGGSAADWVGPGTGLDDAGVKRKTEVVETIVGRIGGPASGLSALEVLRRIGGREIAAMAGAMLAARFQRVPVIIDGFVASAAAAVLKETDHHALDHCVAGHLSAEPAHASALEKLGLNPPLLQLDMRLGEGSGAALAAGIVKAAANTHANMATFEQAGVDNKPV